MCTSTHTHFLSVFDAFLDLSLCTFCICLSACLSACLPVCLSACLPVSLSACCLLFGINEVEEPPSFTIPACVFIRACMHMCVHVYLTYTAYPIPELWSPTKCCGDTVRSGPLSASPRCSTCLHASTPPRLPEVHLQAPQGSGGRDATRYLSCFLLMAAA